MHKNQRVSPRRTEPERPTPSRLRGVRGGPAVPEQRSGERVVSPGAAASGPLPLNGHRVNPLKVHPSAAVTGQSEGVGIGGGEWEEQKRRRKEKRQGEPVSGKSEAAARRSSRHAEGVKAEDLGLGFSSSHTRIENIRGSY